jgi:PA14 domain
MANRKLYWTVLPGIALILLAIVLAPGVRRTEAQVAAEPGLRATSYNNRDLTAPKLRRTDPQINFSWGKRSPSRRIAPDTFSARWTGQVQAPRSGTYTFYMYTSDG